MKMVENPNFCVVLALSMQKNVTKWFEFPKLDLGQNASDTVMRRFKVLLP